MPWFWIVAGPNGAGKTTLVTAGVVARAAGVDLISLNADARTAEILAAEPDAPDANLRAASISWWKPSCPPTNTSTISRGPLRSANRIGVIYVGLVRPEASIRRVRQRHQRGGHDVPIDRIVARWSRSITMFGRLLPQANEVFVFDNSSTDGPVLIARKNGGQITILHPDRIPEIDAVLRANGAD